MLRRIGRSSICALRDDPSVLFFESGMIIDADGAYRAYHPNGRPGLESLSNAGRPGNWWALVTDNGRPNGHPVIQTANDPAPGFYVSMTSLQDPCRARKDPRRYVDAESVYFIVLPAKLGLGVTLGDLVVAFRPATGAQACAVYADVGPAHQIGEGSIALAKALGIPSSPKAGGIGSGIFYFVFKGSARKWPLSQYEINLQGNALLSRWGGLAKAEACFPRVRWA